MFGSQQKLGGAVSGPRRWLRDLVVRGNGEEGRIGFLAADIAELDGVLCLAGADALDENEGLKFLREPVIGELRAGRIFSRGGFSSGAGK